MAEYRTETEKRQARTVHQNLRVIDAKDSARILLTLALDAQDGDCTGRQMVRWAEAEKAVKAVRRELRKRLDIERG